jgi:hypothetical protein
MLKNFETRIIMNEHELFQCLMQDGIMSIENGKTNVRCETCGFGLAVKYMKIANA